MPRVALVDTYCDEKFEAIMACETVEVPVAVRWTRPVQGAGTSQTSSMKCGGRWTRAVTAM